MHDPEEAPFVRPARQSDLDGVRVLYRQLNPDDPELPPDRARATWHAMLAQPGLTVFVVEQAGQVLAASTLIITPNLTRGGRPFAMIENVVTHSAARRRGLGHAVLNAAITAAWGADCYRVMLTTGSKREGTLRFYETAGFAQDTKTVFEIRNL